MPDLIDPDLIEQWLQRRGDAEAALEFYFEHILPLVVALVRDAEAHEELRALGCSTLVSTMGFSPETTIIAAAVFRPRKIVLITTQNNDVSINLGMSFLIQTMGYAYADVRFVEVDPTDTEQIYEAILPQIQGDHSAGTPIVDVTGGKKIMSATAAVAAWEARAPMCYVDGRYDRVRRRPVPGSENVILLDNPTQVRARMLRDRALRWYERGNMVTAMDAFRESRDAQTMQPHFDELALQLARCEAAFMDLDFKALTSSTSHLAKMAARQNIQQLTLTHPITSHVEVLERVAAREPLALLATFRQLVRRYADLNRFDFACLMAYRTLEALVQFGLARASSSGDFDTSAPDLELLTDDPDDLRIRYAEAWQDSRAGNPQQIPRKITLLPGLALLGLTTDLVDRMSRKDLPRLLDRASELAAMRNQSVLAHGRRNLRDVDVKQLLRFEQDLARAILGDEADELDQLERDLVPIDLHRFAP